MKKVRTIHFVTKPQFVIYTSSPNNIDNKIFHIFQTSAEAVAEEPQSSEISSPVNDAKELEVASTATSNGPESLAEAKTETPEEPEKAEKPTENATTEEPETAVPSEEKSDETKETNEDSEEAPAEDSKPVIKKNKSAELKYKYQERK